MTCDIAAILAELYATVPGNRFDDSDAVMFDEPLVAVASADDALFGRLREVVSPDYWTPQQALQAGGAQGPARSVVSWCLPIGERARLANRSQAEQPARPWAYVRTFGQRWIDALSDALVERLSAEGAQAVAPSRLTDNTVTSYAGVGFAARWSERHTAWVAGLGTFSLSFGLITERGIAHRLGSVVTDLALPATRRPYGDDPWAWCLRTARGTCGACIARCPAGAIGASWQDRDKAACREHMASHDAQWRAEFGWKGVFGCGLCQSAVPCETRNPTAR